MAGWTCPDNHNLYWDGTLHAKSINGDSGNFVLKSGDTMTGTLSMNSGNLIQFRDASKKIYSSGSTTMNIDASLVLEIASAITKIDSVAHYFNNGTGDVSLVFGEDSSNEGYITWKEDEDYFRFSDDILMTVTEKVQFRDTAIHLQSATDGHLDYTADISHDFIIGSTEQMVLIDGVLKPTTDSDVDLGTTSLRWKTLYVDDITRTTPLVRGLFSCSGKSTTVPDSTTTYMALSGTGGTTEAAARWYVAKAGVLRNLAGYCSINTSNNSNNPMVVRVNGSNSSLTVTWGSSETGYKADTSNSASVSAGDYISVSVTNNGGFGGSVTWQSFTMEFCET